MSKHSFSSNQDSLTKQLNQAFKDENLPKELQRIAQDFVAKVEQRFTEGADTPSNTADFADKVAILKKSGETRQIPPLFYSPEFFFELCVA